jgi:endonuclease/exonuclease/phosphatase (EEP) superfamily protein YafD
VKIARERIKILHRRRAPYRARPVRTALALLVLAPWLAFAVIRVGGLEEGYALVGAMALAPFAAASCWVPVVVALVLRRRLALLTAVAVAVALLLCVGPRALGGPDDDLPGGRPLSVMTANLRFGLADPRTVLDLVRTHDVELLSLQELTPEAMRRLDAMGLAERFPYRALDARGGAQGTGLLSRYPLRDARTGIPPTGNAMPEATVLVPGARPLRAKAVHPVAPSPDRGVGRWEADLASLPAAGAGPPRLLLGDFNATLDHARMRAVLDRGYRDAAEVLGDGIHGSYWVIQIDHVLLDERLRTTAAAFHTVPGSDHAALTATLSLPAG